MRLINFKSLLLSPSSFSPYLHSLPLLLRSWSKALYTPPALPPSRFHLSWNSFFLLSSPLFYCRCSTAKALGFPPSSFFFSRTELQLRPRREEGQLCWQELQEDKAEGAAQRHGAQTAVVYTQKQHFSDHCVVFIKHQTGDRCDQIGAKPIIMSNAMIWFTGPDCKTTTPALAATSADSSDMRRMHPTALGAITLDRIWTRLSWKLRSVTEGDVLGENQTAVWAGLLLLQK